MALIDHNFRLLSFCYNFESSPINHPSAIHPTGLYRQIYFHSNPIPYNVNCYIFPDGQLDLLPRFLDSQIPRYTFFSVPTLTIVSIPLVAGEAGAVVRPDVVCTMSKHVAWSENGRRHPILSSYDQNFILSSYDQNLVIIIFYPLMIRIL